MQLDYFNISVAIGLVASEIYQEILYRINF